MDELRYADLGRRAYGPVLALQHRLVRRVHARPAAGYLLLVEHDPPVVTLGRRGRAEHVLAPPAALAAAGVEVHRVRRGGDVTWHGPGQVVAYPIVALARRRRAVGRFVAGLESGVIATLRRFGIAGRRRAGCPGVWVGGRKVAAVGVALDGSPGAVLRVGAARRWVCYHGLALNVAEDVSGFGLIRPCGLPGVEVTSISRLLARAVVTDEVKPVLRECLAEALGVRLVPARARELCCREHPDGHTEAA